ncbi:transglycosylase domain-containing protein [Herbiconiux sp. L3-i23]|uniref:transglycosylase domain-containing protein n=1 Tax=Herbiconiux sp. L3-i23 TaxID=2905871 RepID=UPI00206A9AC3|nr:transglycosylase domain-containing protein [Herbiconiux sp. L3-i23]BDI21522.1 carboxypeptidase [Herbiconiux sp. L3-i23]
MSAPFRLPQGRLGTTLSFVGLSVAAGILATVAVTPAIAMTGVAANSSIGMFENLPDYLRVDNLPQKTTVYAHQSIDGQDQNVPIASFYAENRESVAWEQVADVAKNAAIAAEDPRYYEHGGVDPLGVVRAAISNVLGGEVQGASTITQQYVKNVLVAQATGLATEEEREAAYEEATSVSFDRKLKEMRYAIALEKEFSKDQILLGYLNIALYGGRVYGIQAAAQYYYGVNASDLNLNQAASLLAIVNNPANLRLDMPDDPDNGAATGYALTKDRRDYILAAMLEHTMIDQATYDATVAEPITPAINDAPVGCTSAGNAGFFCDYVVNVIRNDPVFGETEDERYSNFIRGGFDVYTTLDLDLQWAAQTSIDENVPKTRYEGVDLASAATAVEAGTGKIKAMAQNKDFNDSGDAAALGGNFSALNYNTDYDYGGSSGFQAASTYKTFTLIAWLRAGNTLGDTFNISEKDYDFSTFQSCNGPGSGTDYIENDANERGNRTVLQSTTTSINGGFMQMGQKLDQCEIRKAATDLFVHRADGTELTTNPAAILGTNEVAPLTMAAAYAGIANHGYVCSPIAIERMVKPDGTDAVIPQSTCQQGIEAPVADAAAYALQTVIESGSATASNPYDGVEHIAKTGTSDGNTTTWTTGASSKIGLSVLVGQASLPDGADEYADLRQLYLDSGQAATARHRIFSPIMEALDDRYGGDDFAAPESRFLRGVQVSVPDVTGQSLEQARSIIEGAGFAFQDGGPRASDLAVGVVAATDPAGGSTASRGSTITVFTSDGTLAGAPMPNLTGVPSDDAVEALTDAGVPDGAITFAYTGSGASATNLCQVASTNPAAGSSVNTSTPITLTLYSPTGSAPVGGGCPR